MKVNERIANNQDTIILRVRKRDFPGSGAVDFNYIERVANSVAIGGCGKNGRPLTG